MLPSCLQDPAADVSVTRLAFNAKLGMVVGLAVRNTILADVLSGEDDAAGLAFEAADVPLLVQCQERLAMLDLLLAPSTVAWSSDLDGLTAGHGLGARLTHTFLPAEGHLVSNGERLPAQAAHKALRVVGAAQGGDDLPGDEVSAAVTAGAIELLVVMGTDVLLVLEEEARLGQAAATHLTGEASDVEVVIVDTNHFPFAGVSTAVALDDVGAASGIVRILLIRNARVHGDASALGLSFNTEAPAAFKIFRSSDLTHHLRGEKAG